MTMGHSGRSRWQPLGRFRLCWGISRVLTFRIVGGWYWVDAVSEGVFNPKDKATCCYPVPIHHTQNFLLLFQAGANPLQSDISSGRMAEPDSKIAQLLSYGVEVSSMRAAIATHNIELTNTRTTRAVCSLLLARMRGTSSPPSMVFAFKRVRQTSLLHGRTRQPTRL